MITRNHTRASIVLPFLFPVIALLLYFAVGLTNLRLPGLQFDEAADAVPALELIHGLPNTAFSTVDILGLRLPLMMGHYTGPSSIYVSLLGMSLFGTTVEGLRISQLLLGAVTLILLWLLARVWFTELVAGTTILLCATAPAFLWWSRSGAHFAAPLLPISIVLLLLLRRWWQTRTTLSLTLAAFVFGLGLTTKLLFAWLIVPIGLTLVIVLGIAGMWRILRLTRFGTLLLCAGAFLVGLLPFIIHNIPSGASFHFIAENAVQSQAYGHNNLDIWANVLFEVTDFLRMMGGDTLHFEAPAGLPLGAVALVASVLYMIVLCIRNRSSLCVQSIAGAGSTTSHLRLRLFLLLCIVTVIPLGTISISNIGARHLFIIAPLSWLLIGISVSDMLQWLRQKTDMVRAIVASGAIIGILVVNHLATNMMIEDFMTATGGHGLWSDAIYSVANKLDTQYVDHPIMALDWGYERNVMFLTLGRVHMREMYEYALEPSPKFADLATVMLRDPSNIYVFHAPDTTAFKGHQAVMERSAARMHKQLEAVDTIPERNGHPNTILFRAVDIPRVFTISPTLATRNASFAGGLTLLGGITAYDPVKREVSAQLYWQSTADRQPDDTVLVHLVDESTGNVIMTADQQPVYGAYPFPQWQRGEVVTDPHWFTLPIDIRPGVYQVRVGVYDRQTGVRRAINDPLNDAAGNSLMLHSFTVR